MTEFPYLWSINAPRIANLNRASRPFVCQLHFLEEVRGGAAPQGWDHKIPNNSRPISLLPLLFKVTEKIASNQFNDFLTQLGNLTCHQSRNRKHSYHSTETLSLLVTGHIFKAMNKKEKTATVLITRHLIAYVMGHSFLSCKGWVRQVKCQSDLKATFNTDRMQSTWLGINYLTLRS